MHVEAAPTLEGQKTSPKLGTAVSQFARAETLRITEYQLEQVCRRSRAENYEVQDLLVLVEVGVRRPVPRDLSREADLVAVQVSDICRIAGSALLGLTFACAAKLYSQCMKSFYLLS